MCPEELPRRKIRLPPPELLVILGIVVVVTAIAIPGILSSKRASRERQASTSLKTLTSAEADYRANDRDGNKVNDFWTGDVSGLYYVKSPVDNREIRLIDEGMAKADAKPLCTLPPGSGPFGGYRYRALERDNSVKGDAGVYQVDTDKSGRKVHNNERFAFLAFPENGREGKYIFMVNENNTIFRRPTIEPRTTWPSDEELMSETSD
jgi:type II secretory pathway pseudopilin PulG